jgi:hypothetical protein
MTTSHRNVALAASMCLVAIILATAITRAQGNGATRLNCGEGPCDSVARGRAAFNDRNLNDLGGNGRACSDCHMPSDSFQLSPKDARIRGPHERARSGRVFNWLVTAA